MAFTLQLLSGMLLQSVIFVLIVQADTVIGMLMNFAALAFLGHIDDIVFSLADRGYFTDSMKEACKDVKEHKTPISKGPWVRRLVLLFFVVVVVFGIGGPAGVSIYVEGATSCTVWHSLHQHSSSLFVVVVCCCCFACRRAFSVSLPG